MKHKRLASIDIGTNTFRLLIADIFFDAVQGRYSLEEVYSSRIITRLGEGIHETGLLSLDAMERSITVLKNFCQTISMHDVEGASAVATSALREASNGAAFLDKAHRITELPLEIISGDAEARMTAAGMLLDMTIPESALMIDIGGGSTEVILARQGIPLIVESRTMGVVYLAGKYMKHDPPRDSELKGMQGEITETVFGLKKQFMNSILPETQCIGTAGTVTSLAAMCQNLSTFEHDKIHSYQLPLTRVKELYAALSKMPSRRRARHIPFELARLDIIVPGTRILSTLMDAFGFQELTVSNYGLREGILIELYRKLTGYAP